MSQSSRPTPPTTTTTQIEPPQAEVTRHGLPTTGTLILRGEPSARELAPAERRGIRWADDVVNNEGQGKKSSKGMNFLMKRTQICCIYHKPRAVGESSSESDSSDSDSPGSDSEVDSGEAGLAKGRSRGCRSHNDNNHDHDNCHNDDPSNTDSGSKRPERKPKRNAYERVPNYNKKGEDVKKEN
ncbi:Type 1 phosphatases regulator ypi1 [Ophidiomyces ophidiicola]|nr:Type 1 phosphatases regulator ypi1 [Ophidiomyces ophidiicola]